MYICILKEKNQRHMYTYTHIRQARLYLVEHPVCVIRCTAVEWQHGLLSSAVKTTGRDYRCFFLCLIAL